MNKEGAIASMLFGLIATFAYIYYFKFGGGMPDQYFGVSPEGIGFIFMFLSAILGIVVSLVTAPPPQDVQDLVRTFGCRAHAARTAPRR